MAEVCKTWFIPTEFVLGLCSIKFEPIEGQPDCGLCVKPVTPPVATGTGSPP